LADLHSDVRRDQEYPYRRSIRCARSIGGKVNVHGVRRFPVALCCTSWSRALEHRPQIDEFFRANHDQLAWKGAGVPRDRKKSVRSGSGGVPTEIGPDHIRRPKSRPAE
jgi:hypothetical protein